MDNCRRRGLVGDSRSPGCASGDYFLSLAPASSCHCWVALLLHTLLAVMFCLAAVHGDGTE